MVFVVKLIKFFNEDYFGKKDIVLGVYTFTYLWVLLLFLLFFST